MFSILFFVFLPFVVESQTVRVSLDSANHLIADWITLNITAEFPKDKVLKWTDFKLENPNFDTVYLDKIDTSSNGNLNIYKQRVVLTCYDTGWQQTPSFQFFINDTSLETVVSNQLPIYIGSIQVDTTKGLKVIKPPIGVVLPKYKWVKWLVVGLFLALLIAVIVYFIAFRKKNGKKLNAELPVLFTPYQRAINAFEQLGIEKTWLSKGEKYFYTQVSDIIRIYLKDAKSIKTLERTTQEILIDFNKKGYDLKTCEELGQLLNLSDKVKFAKALPEEEYHLSIINDGINFINELNKN